MDIIKAGPRHDGAVAALFARCFRDPWPEDMIARLRDRFLVAEEGGEVLGYIALGHVLDEGSIDSVAVAGAHRRRGIADALVAAAVARGREIGLSFITLEVRAGNETAIRLYEKHGFADVGRRKNYYEKPREDAIIMTLVL